MYDKRVPIEPGLLDRRVTIQQSAESAGGSGFPVETWTTLATVYMGRDTLKGMERATAGQVSSAYDSRWMMHYREDMDPDLVDVTKDRRIVFGGRSHNIVAAEHIGRKSGIELTTIASTRVP